MYYCYIVSNEVYIKLKPKHTPVMMQSCNGPIDCKPVAFLCPVARFGAVSAQGHNLTFSVDDGLHEADAREGSVGAEKVTHYIEPTENGKK